MLIGASLYSEILNESILRSENSKLTAQSTELGYILFGTAKAASKGGKIKSTSSNYIANDSIIKRNLPDQEIVNHFLPSISSTTTKGKNKNPSFRNRAISSHKRKIPPSPSMANGSNYQITPGKRWNNQSSNCTHS